MFWLKGCPRCGGDLATQSDIYGRFISCLQCGYYLSAQEEQVLESTGMVQGKVVWEEQVKEMTRAA